MMIDVTTLLIMASCVCSAMSIMFTFYSYFHPENVPFMQGLFDIFRNKEEDTGVTLPVLTSGPVGLGVEGGAPPSSCNVTQAELAAWNQECANNAQCVSERQMRKCGPLQVVFT